MKKMKALLFIIVFAGAINFSYSSDQTDQAALADDASRWLTPTMINARANMFHPQLNFLIFQHLDKMFATRTVRTGGETWKLPYSLRSIEGKFEFEGSFCGLDEFLEKSAANALLVIKDGRIVHETYRNGSDQTTRFISFSMAKSYVSTLIGLALSEGKIKSVDDKVIDYLPEMKDSGYADASIRDLLRMRSGVDWLEVYKFDSDTQLTQVHDNSLVAYKYRFCDYAANESKRGGNPGEKFNYSTLDTSVLGCILERAVGTTGSQYMSEKLWKPAGMERDAFWSMDGPDSVGREFFGGGFNATLRDYGRFGLMMLNKGMANGKQVVPAAWIREATVPENENKSVAEAGPLGYKYQWWTLPGSDAYLAIGLHNQFIYIDPENNTVIVKLSHTPDPLGWESANIAFFQKISSMLAE